MSGISRKLGLALVSAVVGAAIATGLLYATGAAGDQTTADPTGSSSNQSTAIDAASIYSATAPRVVDITASGIHTISNGFPFPSRSETATGTGFEIDSRGDILTAAHVVAGASQITVRLENGTSRSAKVLGADTSIDAAVLQVDPSGLALHPLPLGSSQALAVGDPLAVIGDPFGFNRSLSTGVVSALHRTIQAPDGFTIADAIQTDAAIDPGNSGGPVLNGQGKLVGITDQIATGGSGSDSFTGVGFAVPIDDVKGELSQLEHGVTTSHAYLGVSLADTGAGAALVSAVVANGPAASAGLRQGDLVTAADGKAIHDPNGLIAAIASHKPGDKLTLTVQRGPQQLTVTATLGTQPSQP
jgi:putative serine protease PepD